MLDQLEATPATEDGVWLYPLVLGGQNAALVAWWFGGALRNLSYVVLPAAGDRATNLKDQLAQLAWAGELEGWLTAPRRNGIWSPTRQCRANGKTALRDGLGEPVQVTTAVAAGGTGGAHGAARGGGGRRNAVCCPAEFSARYHEQFFDRLWLHGLVATGVLYAIGVVIYFCATCFARPSRPHKVEQQVADLERQLHERAPAQGALRGAQGAAGVEIRGAGLLENRRGPAAAWNHPATVQFRETGSKLTLSGTVARTKSPSSPIFTTPCARRS